MDKMTEEMLDDVIADMLSDLAQQEAGSEEESRQADAVAKLYAEKKKGEQIDDENKDRKRRRIQDWVLGAARVVVPTVATVFGLVLGLNFETDGAYTSQSFREFRQNNKLNFKY